MLKKLQLSDRILLALPEFQKFVVDLNENIEKIGRKLNLIEGEFLTEEEVRIKEELQKIEASKKSEVVVEEIVLLDEVEIEKEGEMVTVDLDAMTKDELVALAKKNNIDVSGLKLKVDIANAIADVIDKENDTNKG